MKKKFFLLSSLFFTLLLPHLQVFAEIQNVDEWIGKSSKNSSISFESLSGKLSMDNKYENNQGLITNIQILSIDDSSYNSVISESYTNVTILIMDDKIEYFSMTYNSISNVRRSYYTDTCGDVKQPGKYFKYLKFESDQCKGVTSLSTNSIKYYTVNENLCSTQIPSKVDMANFKKDLAISFTGGEIDENRNFEAEIDINHSDIIAKITVTGDLINNNLSGNVNIYVKTNIETNVNELGFVEINDDMSYSAQMVRNYDRTCEEINVTPIPSYNNSDKDDDGGGCFINCLKLYY